MRWRVQPAQKKKIQGIIRKAEASPRLTRERKQRANESEVRASVIYLFAVPLFEEKASVPKKVKA